MALSRRLGLYDGRLFDNGHVRRVESSACPECIFLIEWFKMIILLLYSNIFQALSDAGALHPSIGDVFLLVFGATCQQGSSVAPRSTTARIIMVVVFIILMFLYTSYSANIVALLQSPSKKIKTLKDLYNSRLKLGVDDTVYNHYYFTVNLSFEFTYQQNIIHLVFYL